VTNLIQTDRDQQQRILGASCISRKERKRGSECPWSLKIGFKNLDQFDFYYCCCSIYREWKWGQVVNNDCNTNNNIGEKKKHKQ